MNPLQQNDRMKRFIALCEERTLKTVINQKEQKIEIMNEEGIFLCSRPFSDFERTTPKPPL